MKRIIIVKGDGIGFEIMDVVFIVLVVVDVNLSYDEIEIGEKVYLGGYFFGILLDSWDKI